MKSALGGVPCLNQDTKETQCRTPSAHRILLLMHDFEANPGPSKFPCQLWNM